MNLVGILIPAIILALSFIMTFALYRHFSRGETKDEKQAVVRAQLTDIPVCRSMVERFKKEYTKDIINICYRTGFYGEDLAEIKCKDYGFKGFIIKPYSIEQLSEVISSALKGNPEKELNKNV